MNSNDLHQKFDAGFSDGYLKLKVTDVMGSEYRDGSIVRVKHEHKYMHGVVRYSFGRFEILCTFKDQRFVFGLNHSHMIEGHISRPDDIGGLMIQAGMVYASHG